METNAHFSATDGTPLSDDTLYRQLVGSLIYLIISQLDISYAIHIVIQFMSAPRTTHFIIVLCIIRYVKGIVFHGLHFSKHSSLDLQAYSNADWVGDMIDRRSTIGYCLFLGDSLIS